MSIRDLATSRPRIRSLLAVCAALSMAGCGAVLDNYSYMAPTQYAPTPDRLPIVAYYVGPDETPKDSEIEFDYQLIARFDVTKNSRLGSSLEEKIMEKAREIGGHAVVIQVRRSDPLFNMPAATVWVVRAAG